MIYSALSYLCVTLQNNAGSVENVFYAVVGETVFTNRKVKPTTRVFSIA